MQSLLTLAIEAIALSFPIWLAVSFASYARRRHSATAPRTIHRTLEVLHNISEALPDEVFATDAEVTSIPDVDVPDYSDLFAQADVISNRQWDEYLWSDRHLRARQAQDEQATDEPEQDDFADLLAISAPAQGIDIRWLGTYGVHTMRTLGSLLDLKGARRWSKDQAIAHLTSHYAMA